MGAGADRFQDGRGRRRQGGGADGLLERYGIVGQVQRGGQAVVRAPAGDSGAVCVRISPFSTARPASSS